MRAILSLVIIMLGAVSFLLLAPSVQPKGTGCSGVAIAQEAWKTEFDDVCGKTDNPDALTREDLKGLIDRCDRLKPRIEKLDETERKVYLKRLQMCRDLFAYMLETKGAK